MKKEAKVIVNQYGVFVKYQAGPTFEVRWMKDKDGNKLLADFIKEKIDNVYNSGYSAGFDNATAHYK
jgi:hypothetical protein